MPSIRQRFHLSPCSDFRSHFYTRNVLKIQVLCIEGIRLYLSIQNGNIPSSPVNPRPIP